MKKFLLIFTLFALLFSLSGAQDDYTEPVNNEEEMVTEEEMMGDDEMMAEDEMMHGEEEMMSSEEMAEEEMAEEEMAMMGSSEPTPEELAGHFLELINNQSYGYTWHYEPGVPLGFYEGQAPHGAVLRTFANNIAYDAIQAKVNPLPAGSIIVKENYMPDRTLAAITYMVKMEEGSSPDAGDWFWAKMKPDGTVEAAGAPAGCVGCHGAQQANGWLFNASLQ